MNHITILIFDDHLDILVVIVVLLEFIAGAIFLEFSDDTAEFDARVIVTEQPLSGLAPHMSDVVNVSWNNI